jgi:hypothetical protein
VIESCKKEFSYLVGRERETARDLFSSFSFLRSLRKLVWFFLLFISVGGFVMPNTLNRTRLKENRSHLKFDVMFAIVFVFLIFYFRFLNLKT